MPLIEVTPTVWVTVRKAQCRVDVRGEPLRIDYADVPAVSRALSLVKESPQYAAWLRQEGLA